MKLVTRVRDITIARVIYATLTQKIMKRKFMSKLLGIALAIAPIVSCNPFSFMPKDNEYTGAVFFAYGDKEHSTPQSLPANIMNDLENEVTQTNYYPGINLSLEDWLDREAGKYGKEIDVPLTFYHEQVKVPDEFFYEKGTILKELPTINLRRFSDYLTEIYPEVKSSDFIAVIYNAPYNAGYAQPSGFLVYSSHFPGDNKANFIGNTFAHEFLHLIGATDKDYSNLVNEFDIMKNGSYQAGLDYPFGTDYTGALLKEVEIQEETAREIGWLN